MGGKAFITCNGFRPVSYGFCQSCGQFRTFFKRAQGLLMDADGEKDRPALGEFCQGLPFDTEEDFIGSVIICLLYTSDAADEE